MSKIQSISLVGYPADYFFEFACAMEKANFSIYWVCHRHSDAMHLRSLKVPEDRILDVIKEVELLQNGGDSAYRRLNNDTLKAIEDAGKITIAQMTDMDRFMKAADPNKTLDFMACYLSILHDFAKAKQIDLFSSWRDTAIQVGAFCVGEYLSIPFVVPTRMRIPSERFGFCEGLSTYNFIFGLNENSEKATITYADEVVSQVVNKKSKPPIGIVKDGLLSKVKLLPENTRAFFGEMKKKQFDRGNMMTTHSLRHLISLYFTKLYWGLRYSRLVKPSSGAELKNPYILYLIHQQPESSVDVEAAAYSNQLETIKMFSRAIPYGYQLAVKVHVVSSDSQPPIFYKTISNLPNTVLLHHSVDALDAIRNADLLLGLTGTFCFEGALLGKRSITLAKNHFNHFSGSVHCDDPTKLPALMREALQENEKNRNFKDQNLEMLKKLFATTFDGEVSRNYGSNPSRLNEMDLKNLIDAYGALAAHYDRQ